MRKAYGMLTCILLVLVTLGQISGAKYDLENPLVLEIASNLKAETDLQTAENIWDWMNQNIKYGKNEKSGIENTIREGKGQCSQQAYLAASLLLAAEWKPGNVRIGDGNGHAWVEIKTDVWHRFDTVYTHTFEYEYSLPIYEEKKDYNYIYYHYYEPPEESPKVTLLGTNVELLKDIHKMSITIENQGGTGTYLKVKPFCNTGTLEVVGISHDERFLLSPGELLEIRVYLKGEGTVKIKICEEVEFDLTLVYPTYLKEQNILLRNEHQSQLIAEQSSLSEKQPETLPPQPQTPERTPQTEDIKKIELNSKNQSENAISSEPTSSKIPFLFLPFLIIPLSVTLIFVKKRSNQMVECPFCKNKIGKDWERCPFCETISTDTRIY